MLIRKLTQKEIDTITSYRKEFGDYTNAYNAGPFMPTEKWLSTWEEGKEEEIGNIFGGELYVEFPVEIQATRKILEAEIDKYELCDHPFYSCLTDFISYKYKFGDKLSRYTVLSYLTSTSALIDKVYNYCENIEFKYQTEAGEDKVLVITKGMKLTKIYSKLNKIYKLVSPEVYEDFRRKYSLIFNQEKIKGTYVLSIRPFDFMTMSDNDYDWSSCMSWMNGGCFRRGTIEMMTSPCVVVGYLKGEKPMKEWPEIDNKKWRCLFVVKPTVITSVKNYPYYNDELTTFGVEKLKELAEKNLGYKYNDTMGINEDDESFIPFYYDEDKKRWYGFSFCTSFMYRDFGTSESYNHYFVSADEDNAIIEEFKKMKYKTHISYNYSGTYICSICGKVEAPDDYEDTEGLNLCCLECSGSTTCQRCGRTIYSDDDMYSTTDYDCICSSCIEDYEFVEYLDTYAPYDSVYEYRLAIPTEQGYWCSSLRVQVIDDDFEHFKYYAGADDCKVLDADDWGRDYLVVDIEKLINNWSEIERYIYNCPRNVNAHSIEDYFIKYRTTF